MSKIIIPETKDNQEVEIEINRDTRIAFITGAGVSVGSGMPTYYGKKGVYTNLKKRPEDILNDFNMKNNPHIIWDELNSLIVRGYNAPASTSHKRIAEIESLVDTSLVVTQNVDKLHEKGGAKNVLHIHGEIDQSYCNSCRKKGIFELYNTLDIINEREQGQAPKCPCCSEYNLVPNIVAFDGMFEPVVYSKMNAYFRKPIDVCFVVGTQLQFLHIELLLHYTQSINPNSIIIDINPDLNYHNDYAKYNFKETSDNFFKRISVK